MSRVRERADHDDTARSSWSQTRSAGSLWSSRVSPRKTIRVCKLLSVVSWAMAGDPPYQWGRKKDLVINEAVAIAI